MRSMRDAGPTIEFRQPGNVIACAMAGQPFVLHGVGTVLVKSDRDIVHGESVANGMHPVPSQFLRMRNVAFPWISFHTKYKNTRNISQLFLMSHESSRIDFAEGFFRYLPFLMQCNCKCSMTLKTGMYTLFVAEEEQLDVYGSH
jgi:hypothetical protein